MADVDNPTKVDFWSETMKVYEPLRLPYPELTVKRLQKPPFRFIHDIVAGINARFSAYDHIIPNELKESANIDTKEKKIQYLRALIDYVSKLLNIRLDVSPKKIISGHEPEKTNLLLQCLANACGLAQQDKAKIENVSHQESEEKKLKFADDLTSSHQIFGNRNMLPHTRKKSLTEKERSDSYQRAIADSVAFTKKILGLSVNINVDKPQSIREIGQSIAHMWKEMQESKTETTASSLSEEALDMAIKRQLDKLVQLQNLIKENDAVINNLENLLI